MVPFSKLKVVSSLVFPFLYLSAWQEHWNQECYHHEILPMYGLHFINYYSNELQLQQVCRIYTLRWVSTLVADLPSNNGAPPPPLVTIFLDPCTYSKASAKWCCKHNIVCTCKDSKRDSNSSSSGWSRRFSVAVLEWPFSFFPFCLEVDFLSSLRSVLFVPDLSWIHIYT